MGWGDLDDVFLALSQESAESLEEAEACRSDSDAEPAEQAVEAAAAVPSPGRPAASLMLPTFASSRGTQDEADTSVAGSFCSSRAPSISTGGRRQTAGLWWVDVLKAATRHLRVSQAPPAVMKLVSTCSGILAEASALQATCQHFKAHYRVSC